MLPISSRPRFTKCRLILALLLVSLAFNVNIPADASAESPSDCRWYPHEELMKAPPYNPVGSQLRLGGKFTPPRIRLEGYPMGDRDFKGHGPLYSGKVRLHYGYGGIVVDVWMKAAEVDKNNRPIKDYTAVEGMGRITLFTVPKGWYLNAIMNESGGFTTPGRLPRNINTIPGGFGGDWSAENQRDMDGHNTTRAGVDRIIVVNVVGDTKGNEAGTKTGVEVGLRVPLSLELCRGEKPPNRGN